MSNNLNDLINDYLKQIIKYKQIFNAPFNNVIIFQLYFWLNIILYQKIIVKNIFKYIKDRKDGAEKNINETYILKYITK